MIGQFWKLALPGPTKKPEKMREIRICESNLYYQYNCAIAEQMGGSESIGVFQPKWCAHPSGSNARASLVNTELDLDLEIFDNFFN
jgi:hypothetical protein